MRLLPYGGHALLAEVDTLEESMQLGAALRAAELPYVIDLVVAERSVLVVTDGAPDGLRRDLPQLLSDTDPVAAPAAEVVELPVTYDGPDLDEVASLTGLSPEQVVTAHTEQPWVVAFGGFVPGFAYLTGGDARLEVPRRADPRTRVPAGAVGLGGRYSGVYPRESPGGWQLIGRTDVELWNADRDPPALLRPGARVQFVDATRTPQAAPSLPPARASTHPVAEGRPPAAGSERAVEVLAVGAQVLVQDLGRPGMAGWGVGRGGAADRGAHRLAQRLVANEELAAGLEVLLGGLRLRARGELLVAVTGAPAPVHVDGRPLPANAPIRVPDGAELRLGTPPRALRSYVAVRGGLTVPAVLGSRSTDTLAALGPAPVAVGELLRVGDPPERWPVIDVAPQPSMQPDLVRLRVSPGPRFDRLVDPAQLARDWTVSEHTDRVGVRLIGAALTTSAQPGAPSEGALPGAVQVPPNGRPLVFGVDSPVTGGHPVVAVVEDTDALAQLRPGQRVALHWR